jgi:hypothetical protein
MFGKVTAVPARRDRGPGVWRREVLWRSQAQPPPTMKISWQGRYTDNPHVMTSGAFLIFVIGSIEVQRV